MSNVVALREYNISQRVDALIDQLEEGGLLFCVINGRQDNYLTFEIVKAVTTPDAWQAAHALTNIFATDAELKDAIFNYAFAVGAVFEDLKSVKVPHDQPTH